MSVAYLGDAKDFLGQPDSSRKDNGVQDEARQPQRSVLLVNVERRVGTFVLEV